MNKKDFRIENPCKIVVSDYRITIAIPLKGKCSIATSLLSNDIYQAEQNFQKSYIGTKENSQTLLAIVRLAILYNAVSITDFDELTELYGKKVFICSFVFLSIADMQDFENALHIFENQ